MSCRVLLPSSAASIEPATRHAKRVGAARLPCTAGAGGAHGDRLLRGAGPGVSDASTSAISPSLATSSLRRCSCIERSPLIQALSHSRVAQRRRGRLHPDDRDRVPVAALRARSHLPVGKRDPALPDAAGSNARLAGRPAERASRSRTDGRDLDGLPAAVRGHTLARGAIVDWYPYF